MRLVCRRVLQLLRVALMNYQNQNILITGGSSGIGLALGKTLARQGAHVCLLAQDEQKLSRALKALQQAAAHPDQRFDALSCDITDNEVVKSTLEAWTAQNPLPDILINSAGVTYPGYFEEIEVDTFHWLMDVNYFGTLHVIKALIDGMIERGSGKIVNISSQAGFIGVFGYSGYGASKYAVRGFSDVLRAEMRPRGIQVSIVFPPDTQTPQLDFEAPLKPLETKEIAGSASVLSAEKVADEILKGLARQRYIIIPGLEGKLFYRLTHLMGNLTYPIMDWMVRQAQKKKQRKENQDR
jgi:3-dehydrosphinganine reductase